MSVFSPDTDLHDINERLLKVALNTITLTHPDYDSVLKFNTLKQKCTYDYQLLLEHDSCILDIRQTSHYIFRTQACGHTG